MLTKTFIVAALAYLANAHIDITNPVPYGQSSLNNSPLLADGSDFPCKQRPGVYDAEGASNVYAQGSTQKLEFKGTAVHGGGSCQVSVTTDLEPTKDSIWKVIKSIEGGCPAKGQAGNIGDDANAPVPYTYDYTIPKELSSGNYTVAWTWFNKVGNREMYMNCAPLSVTGSGGSDGFLDTLPDMFVANIGNDCGTVDSKDVLFPDPGKDVDKFNGATTAFAAPSGNCQAAAGGGAEPTQATSAGNAPPSSTAVPVATSAPASVPGGVFITAPSQAAPSQPATTVAPVASAPVVSEAPAATSAAPDSGSGGNGSSSGSDSPSGGFAAGTACTSEGDWNCIGGSSFQRCASGMWSAVQPLAAGVSCATGQSAELNMSSKRGKRNMRRAMRFNSAETS